MSEILTVEFEGQVYRFDAARFDVMVTELHKELRTVEAASRDWPEKADFLRNLDSLAVGSSMLVVNQHIRKALVKDPAEPSRLPYEREKLIALLDRLFVVALERGELS